jgi:hypothetical protein
MTDRRLRLLLIFLLLPAYTWLTFNWTSEGETEAFCPIKKITGVPCPSCGTTRSVLLLTKGQFSDAIHTNPLGLLAGGFLLLAPLWLVYDLLRRRNSTWMIYCWAENKIQSNIFVYSSLIVLVAINWIWNIHKGL